MLGGPAGEGMVRSVARTINILRSSNDDCHK
jgi:hypothetical protein